LYIFTSYWCLTTYFECALASLYRDLVDLQDRHKGHQEEVNIYNRDYSSLSEVIYNALSYNFSQWDKGWYFQEMVANPQKYLRTQPKVKKWLQELKTTHKKCLFLLTNSLP